MDINKTDMFEKFFDGFQQKFIESFKALGEEKVLVRILENQKASKEEYRTYFNCAWEFLEKTAIAEQQAKMEDLEKEWLEMNQQHEQAVKECFEVNSENRKLQKRVDSVTHLIRGLRAEFDLWMDVECPQVERQIELLEQALKGEE